MPVTDIDTYRTAKIMIEQHGDDALFEAMGKANHFMEQGNTEAKLCWSKIADAIMWLQDEDGSYKELCH